MPKSAHSQPPQHRPDPDRHRPAPPEAEVESARQSETTDLAIAREVRATALAHPTARPRRQSAVLRLQRTHGNQHVTTLLQRQEDEFATESSEALGEEVAGEPEPQEEAPTETPLETVGEQEAPAEATEGVSEEEPGEEPGEEPAGGGLIVGDDVADLGAGQMRKSDFLAQVRNVATTAVESVLGGSPLLVLAGEEIAGHLAQYEAMSPAALEQTVRREVPGSAGVNSASDYLPLIGSRVRAVAEQAGGGAGGLLGQAAETGAGLISGISNLFFKEHEGGAHDGADPRAIQARLGPGEPLGGTTGSGLAAAFGHDFSTVRVHTDSRAAELSAGLNARAFTVGRDVAFGAGEYRPGTLSGDALIAHELAHVAQQGTTPAAGGPATKGEGDVDAFEEDADRSAVGAVMSLWGGMKSGLADVSHQALPRLRTGLRLQRCNGGGKTTVPPPVSKYVVPFDRAPKSRPGEQIIFRGEFTHDSPGDYQLVFTGDGGTFDNANGPVTKTVAGLTSGNVYFFIDAGWNSTDAVTVKLEVQRVSDSTVVHTDNWLFSGKGTTPTTITQREPETEGPLPGRYSYKLGPDLGADSRDDYLGQTILERFGQRTCNITLAELKPSWLAAHPNIKTDADITAHFFGTSSNNGTFTVSAGDIIRDRHSGMTATKAAVEAALITMKDVYVDLPQTYEVEPGVSLGNYTIRRTLKADGTVTIRKTRAP